MFPYFTHSEFETSKYKELRGKPTNVICPFCGEIALLHSRPSEGKEKHYAFDSSKTLEQHSGIYLVICCDHPPGFQQRVHKEYYENGGKGLVGPVVFFIHHHIKEEDIILGLNPFPSADSK